jgi:hypothetical protein
LAVPFSHLNAIPLRQQQHTDIADISYKESIQLHAFERTEDSNLFAQLENFLFQFIYTENAQYNEMQNQTLEQATSSTSKQAELMERSNAIKESKWCFAFISVLLHFQLLFIDK